MTNARLWEAAWTLVDGPIDSEKIAQDLLVAVGELVPVQPVRYDLNRRDQWRRYDGRKLLVDLLTQRTQLVTIAEELPVEEGGKLVVLATGKQDRPPQAVARWLEDWPPDHGRKAQVESAVEWAFDTLPMTSFALRVGEEPGGDPPVITGRLKVNDKPPARWGDWTEKGEHRE